MIPERSLEWALDISNVLYMQNYKYISIIMSVPVMEVVRLLGSPEMSLKEPKRALWFQRGVLDVLDIRNRFYMPKYSYLLKYEYISIFRYLPIRNGFYMPKYTYLLIFRSLPILEVVRLLGSPETSLKESRRTVMVPERSLGCF